MTPEKGPRPPLPRQPERARGPDGGARPKWSRDGRELFFEALSPGRTLMAMAVDTTGDNPLQGNPQPLFSLAESSYRSRGNYDVSSDGRFLMIEEVFQSPAPGEEGPPPAIVVVENWFEEFRQR